MIAHTANGKNGTTLRNNDTRNILVQRREVRFVNLATLLYMEGEMDDDLCITISHWWVVSPLRGSK